jgi:hypothetical protein
MGNPHLNADSGSCTACRHHGGFVHSTSPFVLCDSPHRPGAFHGDPEKGCRLWEVGDPRIGKRIIVCGGRDYTDSDRARAALDAAHAKSPIAVIVHGGAPGADTIAKHWARDHGILRDEFQADWQGLGRGAGPIRNQAMADSGAHGCIAFPGGRDTADMHRRAQAAGIPVWKPYV